MSKSKPGHSLTPAKHCFFYSWVRSKLSDRSLALLLLANANRVVNGARDHGEVIPGITLAPRPSDTAEGTLNSLINQCATNQAWQSLEIRSGRTDAKNLRLTQLPDTRCGRVSTLCVPLSFFFPRRNIYFTTRKFVKVTQFDFYSFVFPVIQQWTPV